jgi:hypothetical protein
MNGKSPHDANVVRVTVWHNIATDVAGRAIAAMDGYQPGHPLTPVAGWDVPADTSPLAALAETFAVLNVGDDPAFGTPDPRAQQYRARHNRSLSIGDVVQIGDTWVAVAREGFTTIPAPQYFALDARRPGTTPLTAGDDDELSARYGPEELRAVLRAAAEVYDNTDPADTDTYLSTRQRELLERLITESGKEEP